MAEAAGRDARVGGLVLHTEPRVTLVARPHFEAPVQLPVAWQGAASDGERLAEFAGRLRAMSLANPAERTTAEYLAQQLAASRAGAGSVLEHASYGLLLEGVSWTLAQALAGAEQVTVSMRAGQAVDPRELAYVVPTAVQGDAALEAAWARQIEETQASYVALVEQLMTRYRWIDDRAQRRRRAREAASSVLPGATACTLLVTATAQSWRALLAAQGCETAPLEARRLAVAVLRVLGAAAPAFFGDILVHDASDRRPALRVGAESADAR